MPSGIDPEDGARLHEWALAGAAFQRERYARESTPLRRCKHARNELDTAAAECARRIAVLREEREQFPESTLSAYVRQGLLPTFAPREPARASGD